MKDTTPEFLIRHATMKDYHEIRKLSYELFQYEGSCFRPGYDMEWTYGKSGETYFRNRMQSKYARVLVAIYHKKIVGYLIGVAYRKRIPYRLVKRQGEIENMFIRTAYRGVGIGARLVDAFGEWAQTKGVKNIRVTAFSRNKQAVSFYQKCGFHNYHITLEKDIE